MTFFDDKNGHCMYVVSPNCRLSSLCNLSDYRVIQSKVAELKILAGAHYPKEILSMAPSQKVDKISFLKHEIRLLLRPYCDISLIMS